ncbi:ABC transporter permease [Natronosporangium hydrolyticum]|uniref:Transport permease protein n=1 Tax=Natronosporangium hydrolyticum TaxID=2811111 RepID=A0A895YG87_9ACTN|nr:ABC transporter permease [Natronosporangium hydrolyticum]QSB12698.1 ABC transporter permease [Natronosporangium hydrolyticum]
MFGKVLSFESRRMLRNVPPLFFALAFPVMILAIFGGIYGNDPSDQFDGQGTVDVSTPAYVALVLAVAGLMSFPLGMVEYRSRGFLRRLRATPARPIVFLIAQLLVNGLLCLVGIAILLAAGAVFFDLAAPAHPVAFAGLVVLAGAATFGLGMLIASLARSETSAVVLANLVYFPMIFLTGATIPREIMPDTMQQISDLLPLSYAVRALQWAWLDSGGDELPLALGVLAGTVVASAAVAARLFRWE